MLYILFSFFPYPRKLNDNGSYSTIVSYGYSYRITGADLGGGGGGGGRVASQPPITGSKSMVKLFMKWLYNEKCKKNLL